MRLFFKKFIYLVNILTIIFMLFASTFFVNVVVKSYKDVAKINSKIENEYEAVYDKYKKLILFILRNELPKDVEYFNSAVSATYSLPPVRDFKVVNIEDVVGKHARNDDASIEIECYKKRCIKVLLDREKLLDNISQEKLLGHQDVRRLPVSRFTLFKISVNYFLKSYGTFFVIVLLCLFILYSLQSLFLFVAKFKLARAHLLLSDAVKVGDEKFKKKSLAYKKLFNSLPFVQGLVDEYFTHYIHQLLSRDFSLVQVDIVDILKRIEMFFGYQIAKSELKVKIECLGSIQSLKLDEEILFVVMLNIFFRVINRSKISSVVTVNISEGQNSLNVTICDIGYQYAAKPDNKIKIYELSGPILESLGQKIGADIKEGKEDGYNTTSVKFTVAKLDEVSNIINLKRYGKKH